MVEVGVGRGVDLSRILLTWHYGLLFCRLFLVEEESRLSWR